MRRGLVVVVLVASTIATGCVGAITRDEFDTELRSRTLSGESRFADGASGDDLPDVVDDPAVAFPQVAIAQILERTGGDDLEVTSMTFELERFFATVEARHPSRPREFDLYVFDGARLQGSEPVQRRSGDGLEERTFRVSSIAFERLPEMFRVALGELDEPDARVASVTWASIVPGRVDVVVGVESERRRETVRFDLDGELVRGLG